jgi:uncharacterized Tic20 family protein
MQAEDRNYGTATEHEAEERRSAEHKTFEEREAAIGAVGLEGPASMSARDEKTWSVVAHLSVFLNLVTGFLGPVVALVMWLVYRDRSRKVAFHALQTAIYQGAWLGILFAGWAITGLLTLILIGFLLIPVMALVSVVPFAHGAYAAYKVHKDGEYRYPIVADMIDGR